MLFAPLALAALAVGVTAQGMEFTIPPDCEATCTSLSHVAEACINFMVEEDASQEATCMQLCAPENKQTVVDCHKCVSEVDEVAAQTARPLIQYIDLGYSTMCGAKLGQDTPTPTDDPTILPSIAPSPVTNSSGEVDEASGSSINATSPVVPTPSVTAATNGTEEEKEGNGASTVVIAPAVMLLGLVAAMI